MEKNLKLVLDLLWIQTDTYTEIAELIQENPDKKIITSHKYWFIFKSFHDFLNKKINQEEFIKLWDIDNRNIEKQKYSSQEFFDKIRYKTQEKKETIKNIIIILDKKITNHNHQEKLNKELNKNWNHIFFLD